MNKEALIRHTAEQLIGKGNLDAIADAFSENYTAHAEGKSYHGHKFIEDFTKLLQKAIPDIEVKEIDFLVQTEDKVAWQRTLVGTHESNMMGLPPSGKRIVWNEMVVSRFENGKIIEEWVVSELLGQLLLQRPKSKKL